MTRRKRHCINLSLVAACWLLVVLPFLHFGGYGKAFAWDDHEGDSIVWDSVVCSSSLIQPIALDSLPCVTIPFIDSLCFITDSAGSLQPFFRELEALQGRLDTVVRLVHLGDSHIQAGYLTGQTMRRLHDVFGNAGRGWVSPLKLSKVNEPNDYFIQSVVRDWQVGRCIQATPKAPIGIGGIGIHTVSPSVNLDVVIGPINGAGYSFNQAILYRSEKSMPMLPAGTLKDSIHTALATAPVVPGIVADTFFIGCLSDTLQLHSTRRKQGTDSLLPASSFDNNYFGFQLTNGGPGLLYHSIGVNGSMFIHYTKRAYLEQLAALKPSLLIVSLGTNETFGRRFNKPEFKGQVEAFVRLVKEVMPQTALLLTTPAECYKRVTVNKKRSYVRNDNSQKAAEVIRQVAEEEEIACWDLFQITGGKNACQQWHSKKLMGRDRIHFTKEGYAEQGELLYRALIKSYNEHLER